MDCHNAENLILTDHLDGRLKGEALLELEEHLKGCVSCRDLRERAVGAEQFLRADGKVQPPESVWLAVQERIMPDGPSAWERLWEGVAPFFEGPRRLAFSATLATAVIVFGVALPGILSRTASNESDIRVVSAALVGGEGDVLSVGGEVWGDSVEQFLL
jgi:anti-sigma factor RsiW